MFDPRTSAAGLAANPRVPVTQARSERRPHRVMPLTRKYEVAGLTLSGDILTATHLAPATPSFEEAFSGFARGTLIATANGPVAVEDLTPGMDITVEDGRHLPLLWIGQMTLFPNIPNTRAQSTQLTRITADAFGLGKPFPDLMLGGRARLMYHHARCEALLGQRAAAAPAHAFVDGLHTISISPMAPVRVYHLALERQAAITANGVEVESFHPGLTADKLMESHTWDLFLGLFPHAKTLRDFGPMPYQRLTAFELETIRNA